MLQYVRIGFDKTLYFEFPKIRADGSVITANEAARLTAFAKDAEEEITESQLESSPPPTSGAPTESVLNRFLNILKFRYKLLVDELLTKNNYGTPPSAVKSYTKAIGGC